MKKVNTHQNRIAIISVLLLAALGLAGCGGGDSEVPVVSDPVISISKVLPLQAAFEVTGCGVFGGPDVCTVSPQEPAPGEAHRQVAALATIGVTVRNKQCGSLNTDIFDANGALIGFSAAGFAPIVVLPQIRSSELDKAKTLGFIVATDDYLKRAVLQTFTCESRGL